MVKTNTYKLQISKTEIESLICNKEIYSKLNFGSKTPFLNIDNYYYYLYKTVCLVTKMVYVGVRLSRDHLRDKYIGGGVETKLYKGKEEKFSKFHNAISYYGRENFVRQDLLFFSSREDSLRAESLIVTQEWVDSEFTYNTCLGGGCPPRLVGEKNGNYGKRWTNKKKQELSSYFKKNRDTSGGNNTRAIPYISYDVFTDEVKEYGSCKCMCIELGFKNPNGLQSLSSKELMKTVRGKRYIVLEKSLYLLLKTNNKLESKIQEIIDSSRFKKLINKHRNGTNS